MKFTSRKLTQYLEKKWWSESREEMIWVVTRVSDLSFLTLGTVVILGILGVDMSIFMWGLWFWLGFTLKIFLSNFIAWVIMVTQDSYHNWDLIRIEGKMWYIQKINALFTKVEQFDGVVFNIPNAKFLENNVENFHTNNKRRVEVLVWVDYSTDLILAKKVIMQVLGSFANILKAPKPEVIIVWFENSAINLSVRFWIDSKWDYFESKSNVTETINLAFKQAWITIPFPQITLSNRENFKIDLVNKK
jgi:small conductance mechanosensitive channel